MRIPVFGNGDVDTPEKAVEMKLRYGVDGVMIGRASIGYPWIFREVKHFMQHGTHLLAPTMEERVEACRFHLEKSIEWKGEKLGVLEMRRHYANYFRGIPNFKAFRTQLVTEDDPSVLFAVLDEIPAFYASGIHAPA